MQDAALAAAHCGSWSQTSTGDALSERRPARLQVVDTQGCDAALRPSLLDYIAMHAIRYFFDDRFAIIVLEIPRVAAVCRRRNFLSAPSRLRVPLPVRVVLGDALAV